MKLRNIADLSIGILGAGQIGQAFKVLAERCEDAPRFRVSMYDKDERPNASILDVNNIAALRTVVNRHDILVSALPHNETIKVSDEVSQQGDKMYLDFTEDIAVGREIIATNRQADQGSVVIPHCGLAPGAVSIIAADLCKQFDLVEKVKMRVGSLPVNCTNSLYYYRSWSTNGLLNEYIKRGERLWCGGLESTRGLDNLEALIIDGQSFEAFNTSGGSGTFLRSVQNNLGGAAKFSPDVSIDYKTLRFPGHCDKMRFLLWELEMTPEQLTPILDRKVPRIVQDMIVIYVEVTGQIKGETNVRSYAKRIYGENGQVSGDGLTAIQLTTAGGALAVMQVAIRAAMRMSGLEIAHFANEDFALEDVIGLNAWRPYIE